jgi:chromosome partitioning protein
MTKTRVIALINQKGGVGKTTSVVNIGFGLSSFNKKVLILDLDPQANLTHSLSSRFKKPQQKEGSTIYDVLKGNSTPLEVVKEEGNVSLIPADISLSGIESEFGSLSGREVVLKRMLFEYAHNFDFVLLDCPPSLGLLTINALVMAREVFVPVEAKYLALEAIVKLQEIISVVKERLNSNLNITGVIVTGFDKRKNLAKRVFTTLKERFAKELFKTPIRENVSLAEAPEKGVDIFDYNKSSNGAKDYMSLCGEIMEMGKLDNV